MIYLYLFIASALFAFICMWLAGRFNAMMDTVEHHPLDSIFNKPKNWTGTKFGIKREYWYNLNKQGWLAKYNNYDVAMGKRKTRILFWRIHFVQIYDGWHFWKTLSLMLHHLDNVFTGMAAIFLYLYLGEIFIAAGYILIDTPLRGVLRNKSFSLHYENWLKKGK